ncbi:hypothetical protein Tco_0120666 [Tanacetum coccineum]
MDWLLIRNEEVRFAAKCGLLLLLLQIPLRALTDIVRRFVIYIKASYLLRMDTLDDHSNDIPKRARKAKSYGYAFQVYLVEGSRDQIGSQYSYCYSIKEDPRIYNKAMQSRDAAFWKEAIDDENGSIM